jgi:hypothetical protein
VGSNRHEISGLHKSCSHGLELDEIIQEMNLEDERIAKSVNRKRPGDEGRKMSRIKWPCKGTKVTHEGSDVQK